MEGHRHVVLQVHRRDRPVARSIGAQNDESAGPARGRVLECQQPAVALGVAARREERFADGVAGVGRVSAHGSGAMIDRGDRVGIASRDRCRRRVAVAMLGGSEPLVELGELTSVIVEFDGGGDAAGPPVDRQPGEGAPEGRPGGLAIVA